MGRLLCTVAVLAAAALTAPAASDTLKDQTDICADEQAGADPRIDACTWLLQSEQLEPDSIPTILFNRGDAYRAKRQYDRAIEDYNQAIRLRPDDAGAFNNRGSIYEARGRNDFALQDYEEAIRLKPDHANALNNLAWLYATDKDAQFRDGKRAVTLANKAVSLTDSAITRQILAAAQAENGQFAAAVAE